MLIAHPTITDAAVVARPDPALGQVPVAAIVLREGATDPGDEALLRACRASLAGFKVPAAIVRLDALPRTAGGKLRREAVRALSTAASRHPRAARRRRDRLARHRARATCPVLLPRHAVERPPSSTGWRRRSPRPATSPCTRSTGAGRGLAPRRPAPARHRRPCRRPRRLPRRPRDRGGRPRRRELRRRARARDGGPAPGPRRGPWSPGSRRTAPLADRDGARWFADLAGDGGGRPRRSAARRRRPRRSCARSPATRRGTGCPSERARSSGARATGPSPTRRCSASTPTASRASTCPVDPAHRRGERAVLRADRRRARRPHPRPPGGASSRPRPPRARSPTRRRRRGHPRGDRGVAPARARRRPRPPGARP